MPRPRNLWTVKDVIENLESLHDARLEWWQRMDMLLVEKRYEEALSYLKDNQDDSDFNEQVEIVARTINEYTLKEINIIP